MYRYPFATVPIQRGNRIWPPDQLVLLLPTNRAPYPPSFIATGETQRHGCDLTWRGISEGVVESRKEKAWQQSPESSPEQSPEAATGRWNRSASAQGETSWPTHPGPELASNRSGIAGIVITPCLIRTFLLWKNLVAYLLYHFHFWFSFKCCCLANTLQVQILSWQLIQIL
jgi:hypothetical protein